MLSSKATKAHTHTAIFTRSVLELSLKSANSSADLCIDSYQTRVFQLTMPKADLSEIRWLVTQTPSGGVKGTHQRSKIHLDRGQ